jgi:hypothetical protein
LSLINDARTLYPCCDEYSVGYVCEYKADNYELWLNYTLPPGFTFIELTSTKSTLCETLGSNVACKIAFNEESTYSLKIEGSSDVPTEHVWAVSPILEGTLFHPRSCVEVNNYPRNSFDSPVDIYWLNDENPSVTYELGPIAAPGKMFYSLLNNFVVFLLI